MKFPKIISSKNVLFSFIEMATEPALCNTHHTKALRNLK